MWKEILLGKLNLEAIDSKYEIVSTSSLVGSHGESRFNIFKNSIFGTYFSFGS